MGEVKRETLLKSYTIGVQHPEVSGFEVLELLDTRSKLARSEPDLTDLEREALERADALFLDNVARFYESLLQVTSPLEARRRAKVPPSHWWWYLEKLARAERVAA
ncbi:MAG: hypothetical protein NUW06_02955 [Candidatus Acetothermia bacterium]|jgi:hypothetical protein|nr:hypothetical protein [Candidatus Acetothermia bacterium]MDH7504848.1 hypothetical protein [Candidatus Acetothermia bacterium]